MFSVKGLKDQQSLMFNRGHINLVGMKAELINKHQITEEQKMSQ